MATAICRICGGRISESGPTGFRCGKCGRMQRLVYAYEPVGERLQKANEQIQRAIRFRDLTVRDG